MNYAQTVQQIINNIDSVGVSYSSDAQTVFTRIETTSGELLTVSEKTAINRFINEQVAVGNWSRVYSFIPLCGLSSSAKARVDWITGVTATLHFVTGSNPTYSPTTGFTTSGTNYIDTKVNPSTINGGASVSLDTVAYSIHIIDHIDGGNHGIGVFGTSADAHVLIQVTSGGVCSYKIHTNITSSITDTENLGFDDDFYSVARIGSLSTRFKKDWQDQRVLNNNTSEVVPAGRTFHVGGINNNGTPSPFGAAKYGTFMVNTMSGWAGVKFFPHWEILMMELSVKSKSALYPIDLADPGYSASDTMILNSEGQSNAMFCGSSANAALADSQLLAAIDGANVLWRGIAQNETAAIETLLYNDNNSQRSPLLNHFGTGMRAAYELVHRQNLKLYLWHYGISATGLYPAFVNGWYPDDAALFTQSHTTVFAGCKSLITGTIKKIIFHWSQGEADATAPRTEAEYTADFYYYLKKKIDFIESQGYNLSVAKLHVMIEKIYRNLPGVPIPIRAAQAAFSIANFEATYTGYGAKVTSMMTYDRDRIIHGDLTHPDVDGVHILAYRLAMFMAKL